MDIKEVEKELEKIQRVSGFSIYKSVKYNEYSIHVFRHFAATLESGMCSTIEEALKKVTECKK